MITCACFIPFVGKLSDDSADKNRGMVAREGKGGFRGVRLGKFVAQHAALISVGPLTIPALGTR